MENNNLEGAKPLTLHAITEEPTKKLQIPVKKLIPKKKDTKPVEKVVFKDHMQRMTNRDWTGLKKRLRFMLKAIMRDYEVRMEHASIWPHRIPSKAKFNSCRKKDREMIAAFQTVLSFEGTINGVLTKADFTPSNYYRFRSGPDRIYDNPWDEYPTINFDKHPDAYAELERVTKGFEDAKKCPMYGTRIPRDSNFHNWKR